MLLSWLQVASYLLGVCGLGIDFYPHNDLYGQHNPIFIFTHSSVLYKYNVYQYTLILMGMYCTSTSGVHIWIKHKL